MCPTDHFLSQLIKYDNIMYHKSNVYSLSKTKSWHGSLFILKYRGHVS